MNRIGWSWVLLIALAVFVIIVCVFLLLSPLKRRGLFNSHGLSGAVTPSRQGAEKRRV